MNKRIRFIEGVRKAWDKEHFVFDKQSDLPKDIIFLCSDNSGHKVTDNLTYYYGYEFNRKCPDPEIKEFRNAIKHYIGNKSVFYSRDTEDFVYDGLFRMDALKSINDFTVFVSTANSYNEKTLTGLMCQICEEHIDDDTDILNIRLIKKMCEDVTFDEDKAYKALKATRRYRDDEEGIKEAIAKIKETFEEQKLKGKLFKMKLYRPVVARYGFSDFLKFANETEQRIYEKLKSGTEVLICEDFITSGSTVNYIIEFLNSFNPNTKISVFVLVNQLRQY